MTIEIVKRRASIGGRKSRTCQSRMELITLSRHKRRGRHGKKKTQREGKLSSAKKIGPGTNSRVKGNGLNSGSLPFKRRHGKTYEIQNANLKSGEVLKGIDDKRRRKYSRNDPETRKAKKKSRKESGDGSDVVGEGEVNRFR